MKLFDLLTRWIIYQKFSRLNYIFLPLLLISFGCGQKSNLESGTAAVDPNHALATFQVPKGFKIEMIASEPMVSDPVDMEIDEYGNFYVVEMHGYPLDKSGSGKIILLKDTDGDGRMDKRTVFADGLVLPNGILRWKKGVLVTDAPNVLYLEDSNGDGKADIRDTVLTGFSLSNPHVNVNNPVYGLDNWIYLAHRGAISTRNYEKEFGDKGSEVFFPKNPKGVRLPKNAGSNSVRFRPENFKLEMLSSKGQFGQTFDEWGHHLYAENGDHLYQEVIASRYLQRNPNLFISSAIESISDHGKVSEVFPITKVPERQLFSGVGVMTSSSGIVSYLGGLFPPPYDQNITFVCESVSNLVHVDILRDSGASFVASRMLPHSEFLASTDAWSRPVNTYIGPDGALYVLDYYRQIIEHPEWMSEEAVKAGGLYNGNDMGRIYRITPTEAPPAEWMKGIQLGDAKSEQLVEKLSSPNIWWRLNAQRLLVDRADKNSISVLIKMVENKDFPMGRLHALWTLEGLQQLSQKMIVQALKDSIAGIRENAIKLAENHLVEYPELVKDLLSMTNDTNAKVRYQLLLTLGFINTPQAAEARNRILFKDINDQWVQIATISASSLQMEALLKVVLSKYKSDIPAFSSLVQRLTTMIGISGTPETISKFMQSATSTPLDSQTKQSWQTSMLEGIANGLEVRKSKSAKSIDAFKNEQSLLVNTFFKNPVSSIRNAALHILKIIGLSDQDLAKASVKKAVLIANDKSLPISKRTEALNFMVLQKDALQQHMTFLENFLNPHEELSIQLAALRTLITIDDNSICNYLLEKWPNLTPELRDAALNAFFTNPERIALLLDAIESGKVDPGNLGWQRTTRLMSQSDKKLRDKARLLLTKNDEDQVIKDYQKVLQVKGDEIKGKTVYMQHCSMCHQVRGKIGVEYGPDLGTIHNWLPKNILANVLNPNLAIAGGFDLWAVELKDGEIIQGLIASETSDAITLRPGPGEKKLIRREEIKSMKSANVSAMPSDLAKQINQQQMADLLAFLRENK